MGRKSTESREYSKSAGQTRLYELVRTAYPETQIKQDLNLRKFTRGLGYGWNELSQEYGQTLAPIIADVVLFKPLMIFEYNGEQHYRFTAHWHGDAEGYREALERDNQKIWLCQRLGIPMVVFSFDENMSAETLAEKIEAAEKRTVLLPGYRVCSSCGLVRAENSINDAGICVACLRGLERQRKENEKNDAILAEKRSRDKVLRDELKHREPTAKEVEAQQVQKDLRRKISKENRVRQQESEEQQARKQLLKDRQREQQESYRQSDEYKEKQKNLKEKSKELYQKQKEFRKSLQDRRKADSVE
jgi:hypothetical protein